jgi:hypothetical protein
MWSIARQSLQSLGLVNTKACSPTVPDIQTWLSSAERNPVAQAARVVVDRVAEGPARERAAVGARLGSQAERLLDRSLDAEVLYRAAGEGR